MGNPAKKPDSKTTELIDRFLGAHGWKKAARTFLPGDFSSRYYIRLKDGLKGRKALLMRFSSPQELPPYLAMQKHLQAAGARVAAVYASDLASGMALIEDLGENDFFDLIASRGDAFAYKKAINVLTALQLTSVGASAGQRGLPLFDALRFMEQLAHFPDTYALTTAGVDFTAEVKTAFMEMWPQLLEKACMVPQALMLRDCHAGNIMVLAREEIALLDFQDGGVGPISYDIASLLEDTRRDLPAALRSELLEHYMSNNLVRDCEAFIASYHILAVQRHLRVLAIVARRWKEKKEGAYGGYFTRTWSLLLSHRAEPQLKAFFDWLNAQVPEQLRDGWRP
jgi:aminoglycoside/choline kinase family phosphotransferase